MKLYKKGFEKKWLDTIATVKQINGVPTAIHLKDDMYYELNDQDTYLILCGLQEFSVINGKITRVFCSIKHPYYTLNI